ncbi:MAG TPA: alpha/beta hydrolase [Gaiellaceae bacterium]|nr:alpha/beta hydrolase [Gaiellaceae bacterium]
MFTSLHRGGSGPPLVLVHGFTDTWRGWELVLPALERHHDVLAPTLPGHAGGPPLGEPGPGTLADGVEHALDEAGFERAHIVGNSLGGYIALQLAERGRAESVVALAPAGGWGDFEVEHAQVVDFFTESRELIVNAAPYADSIMSTPEGRRRATEFTAVRYEHIPADLLAHQLRGAARCESPALLELSERERFPLDASRIDCPLRIVWGREDRVLPWPGAAARWRAELPHADWIELDGVGHCPQLDIPDETAELILGFTTT